jgi:hypothetical protein
MLVAVTFLHVHSGELRALTVEVPHWSRALDAARVHSGLAPWEWHLLSLVEADESAPTTRQARR